MKKNLSIQSGAIQLIPLLIVGTIILTTGIIVNRFQQQRQDIRSRAYPCTGSVIAEVSVNNAYSWTANNVTVKFGDTVFFRANPDRYTTAFLNLSGQTQAQCSFNALEAGSQCPAAFTIPNKPGGTNYSVRAFQYGNNWWEPDPACGNEDYLTVSICNNIDQSCSGTGQGSCCSGLNCTLFPDGSRLCKPPPQATPPTYTCTTNGGACFPNGESCYLRDPNNGTCPAGRFCCKQAIRPTPAPTPPITCTGTDKFCTDVNVCNGVCGSIRSNYTCAPGAGYCCVLPQKICTPGERKCDTNANPDQVIMCNSCGTGWITVKTCANTEICSNNACVVSCGNLDQSCTGAGQGTCCTGLNCTLFPDASRLCKTPQPSPYCSAFNNRDCAFGCTQDPTGGKCNICPINTKRCMTGPERVETCTGLSWSTTTTCPNNQVCNSNSCMYKYWSWSGNSNACIGPYYTSVPLTSTQYPDEAACKNAHLQPTPYCSTENNRNCAFGCRKTTSGGECFDCAPNSTQCTSSKPYRYQTCDINGYWTSKQYCTLDQDCDSRGCFQRMSDITPILPDNCTDLNLLAKCYQPSELSRTICDTSGCHTEYANCEEKYNATRTNCTDQGKVCAVNCTFKAAPLPIQPPPPSPTPANTENRPPGLAIPPAKKPTDYNSCFAIDSCWVESSATCVLRATTNSGYCCYGAGEGTFTDPYSKNNPHFEPGECTNITSNPPAETPQQSNTPTSATCVSPNTCLNKNLCNTEGGSIIPLKSCSNSATVCCGLPFNICQPNKNLCSSDKKTLYVCNNTGTTRKFIDCEAQNLECRDGKCLPKLPRYNWTGTDCVAALGGKYNSEADCKKANVNLTNLPDGAQCKADPECQSGFCFGAGEPGGFPLPGICKPVTITPVTLCEKSGDGSSILKHCEKTCKTESACTINCPVTVACIPGFVCSADKTRCVDPIAPVVCETEGFSRCFEGNKYICQPVFNNTTSPPTKIGLEWQFSADPGECIQTSCPGSCITDQNQCAPGKLGSTFENRACPTNQMCCHELNAPQLPADVVSGCPVRQGLRISQGPKDCSEGATHCEVNAYDIGTTYAGKVEVYAANFDGFVYWYNQNYTDGETFCIEKSNKNYGNRITIIRTDDNTPTGSPREYLIYSHLHKGFSQDVITSYEIFHGKRQRDPNSTNEVERTGLIRIGTYLANADNNGCSTNPHLHFEHRDSQFIPDDAEFFNKNNCGYK